jgi:hypothetical protein
MDSVQPLGTPSTAWITAAADSANDNVPTKAGGVGGGKGKAGTAGKAGAPVVDEPALECCWCVALLRTFAAEGVGSPPAGSSLLGLDSLELTAELVERTSALLAMPKPGIGLPNHAPPSAGAKGSSDAQGSEALLARCDKELAAHLAKLLGVRGVDALLAPHAQRLCVSLLSADSAAFVWDLCLLGGWRQLQPALASALLCMRDGLLAATDAAAVRGYLTHQAALLTPTELQRALGDNFMPAIRAELGAPEPSTALDLVRSGFG